MKISNTIKGSWYIVTLSQKQEDQPNAVLVMDWGRGLFCDYDGKYLPESKKSLEEIPEIASLGSVENESYIYEQPVNYWDCLAERRLVQSDGETFVGIGSLGTAKRSHTQDRWITPQTAEEFLKAGAGPHYTSTSLYVVRYRDVKDRHTNPFHQTAIIAQDEGDIRRFIQKDFDNWFDEGYRNLTEIAADSQIRLLDGMVVMPEVLLKFKIESKGERSRYW